MNFQRGQQGRCGTNPPPQGPYYGMPWGYQGPWGWWNGPVNQGPTQTEEQTEGTEKHEGTPTNQTYGEPTPSNFFGYPFQTPMGWNQTPNTWWNYGNNFNPYYSQYGSQYGHQNYNPYYNQYGHQNHNPYVHPYQQSWTPWNTPQVPYGQHNWNDPQGWNYGTGFPRAWTPGFQNHYWNHPHYGGQDYGWHMIYGQQATHPWYMGTQHWWNQMRPVCEQPVAA